MLVLLTGIPAVGKTTVAEYLQSTAPQRFGHFRFAPLIWQAVRQRRGEDLSYAEFKTHSAQLVTPADITVATEHLVATAASADSRVLLVDSHAVSKEHYGYRATPDSPQVLARFGYRMIVHLFTSTHEVMQRARCSGGRHPYTSKRDAELLEQTQIATSVFYAATIGCPLHLIDASGPVSEVATIVEDLLNASR